MKCQYEGSTIYHKKECDGDNCDCPDPNSMAETIGQLRQQLKDKTEECALLREEAVLFQRHITGANERLVTSNEQRDKAQKDLKAWELLAETRGAALDEAQKELAKRDTLIANAKLFAEWVECLGRSDCEIYKHELKASADTMLERIEETVDNER